METIRELWHGQISSRRTFWIIIALDTFVALTGLFVLSHQSLRLDEAQSLWQTANTPKTIIYLVAQDVHVPLYHMLLYLWQLFLGNGVTAVRALSLLFGLALIPMTYLLGKEAVDRRIGLVAAALMAISPFMNWYNNEARMYALLALVTVVNQYFFLRVWKRGKAANWIWYTMTAIVGAYTHYFFSLVLITQGLVAIIYRRKMPPHFLRRMIVVGILVGLTLTPWLIYVTKLGFAANTQPFLQRPSTIDLFNTFSQFLFGYQTDHINTFIVSLWPLSVLLAFLSLNKTRRLEGVVLYLAYAAFLPALAAFVASLLIHPFFLSRYLVVALPALYVFLVWLIFAISKRWRTVILVGLAIGMLATLFQEATSVASPVKEDYASAAAYLQDHASVQDVIVVSAPFTIYPVEYYYHGSDQIYTLPLWNRFETGAIPPFQAQALPAQVQQIADDHQNLWVLLSYNQGYEKQIKDYLDHHYKRLKRITFSQDLTLDEYQLRYNPPLSL